MGIKEFADTESACFIIEEAVKNEKEKELAKLNRLEVKNMKLTISNHLLQKRSLELGRLKMVGFLKTRTLLLCDSSNFSEYVGYVDEVLLETHVKIIDLIVDSAKLKLTFKHDEYDHYLMNLGNGELCEIKTLTRGSKESEERSLTLLSHESKILQLIGEHGNIVEQLGLCCIEKFHTSIGLMLRYTSDMNLTMFLKNSQSMNSYFVKTLVAQLQKGFSHIHEKDVLHNNLHTDNIYLRSSSGYSIPVISNFEWACRLESAKCLTLHQKNHFGKTLHLPVNVRNGTKPPCLRSEYFSFGFVMSQLCRHGSNYRNLFVKHIMEIAKPCLGMSYDMLDLSLLVEKNLNNLCL